MYFRKPNLALLALLGWVLLRQVIAVPVSRSPSPGHTSTSSSSSSEEDFPILPYNHGDFVGVRPSEYEKNPPKKISIHPGVVVGGPNHMGKYNVAMISKKLPNNPPQEDIKHFYPEANFYGNVALDQPKKVRPEGMKPWKSDETGETAKPMSGPNLRKLHAAMYPHRDWRPPTPPLQLETSQSRGGKSGKGRRSKTGNKGSGSGPKDPRSHHGVPMQYQPQNMQVVGPSHHLNYPNNPLHHTGPPVSRYDSGSRHHQNLPPMGAVPNSHSGPYKSGAPSHRPINPYSADSSRHAPTAYGASFHTSATGGRGSQHPVPQHFSQPPYLAPHPQPHLHPYQHQPLQQHAPVFSRPVPSPSVGPMYHTGPTVHQSHPMSGPNPYHVPPVDPAHLPPPGPYHNPSAHYRPPPLWRTDDKRPAKRMRR